MSHRVDGEAVVITGGTHGFGKALGLEFARTGATVFLTHRWGSADEDALRGEFAAESLPEPYVLESDVSDPDATRALMASVASSGRRLRTIVSNVAFAKRIDSM